MNKNASRECKPEISHHWLLAIHHTRLQTLKRSLSYHNNYATAWRCGADLDGPVKLAVNTSIAETVLGKLNTFFKCPKRREGTISHRIQTIPDIVVYGDVGHDLRAAQIVSLFVEKY